jgi:hypothetical protein
MFLGVTVKEVWPYRFVFKDWDQRDILSKFQWIMFQWTFIHSSSYPASYGFIELTSCTLWVLFSTACQNWRWDITFKWKIHRVPRDEIRSDAHECIAISDATSRHSRVTVTTLPPFTRSVQYVVWFGGLLTLIVATPWSVSMSRYMPYRKSNTGNQTQPHSWSSFWANQSHSQIAESRRWNFPRKNMDRLLVRLAAMLDLAASVAKVYLKISVFFSNCHPAWYGQSMEMLVGCSNNAELLSVILIMTDLNSCRK